MEIKSGTQEGLLSLPSGGGALRGLGERFQPDLLRGSGNYGVPIELPKGPNNLKPNVSLRYSTGQGNGAFGVGWQLSGAFSIQRRTDRGIPRYDEGNSYILGGGELLVPVGGGRYRPRSDNKFWDIRRTDDGWTIRTKEGRTFRLGINAATRIEDSGRIFAWMCEEEIDQAGNVIHYSYTRDANHLYLSQIAWSIYELRLIYEQRPDVMHSGRSGFSVRTRLRCVRIERHTLTAVPTLSVHYDLTYTEAEGSRQSLLTQIALVGEDDDETEAFPPLRMTYTQYTPTERYLLVDGEQLPLPALDRSDTTMVDMDGDGLPDILQTSTNAHRYWRNLGAGRFSAQRTLGVAPVGMNLAEAGVTFADLTGDGTADLFRIGTRLSMAVSNTGAGRWDETPIAYQQQFPLLVSAASTRLVDLNGDGVVDLLQSGQSGFTLVYNDGDHGWDIPETVKRIHDLDRFPDVALDDEGIHLVDMTGDGLTDIAYIESGQVWYWPCFGYGQWGDKVEMLHPPVLPQGFDRSRLYLADLDGDGSSDLVYVDFDRVYYWLNQSGFGWSERYEVPFVPPPNVAAVQMLDLLGTGTRGLLWSNTYRSGAESGYRFLDLSSGEKPYLLTSVDNGFGGATTIHYTTTSALQAQANASGEPWNSYLPFPIHVVAEMVERDFITDQVWTTRLAYQRGYYDPVERVFRGFETVDMTSIGDDNTPTLAQRTTFNLGAMLGPEGRYLQNERQRAYDHAISGSVARVEIYTEDENGDQTLQSTAVSAWDARTEFDNGVDFVYFPFLAATAARDVAEGVPDRIDSVEYTYDEYGNLLTKRRSTRFADQSPDDALISTQTIEYVNNETEWLIGLTARIETRDGDGVLLSDKRLYYDGNPFVGLPAGEADRGLLRRSEELVLADALLPAGYADEIAPEWGLRHDVEGYYRTVEAYDHDALGNIRAQRDTLGREMQLVYDADSVFPISITDADGSVSQSQFDPRTAQPMQLALPGGTITRYDYSPLGRLRAQFDTTRDGSVQLTQYFHVNYAGMVDDVMMPSSVTSARPLEPGVSLADLMAAPDLTAVPNLNVEFEYYDSRGNAIQRSRRASNDVDPVARWVIASRRTVTRSGEPAEDFPNIFAASPAYQGDVGGAAVRYVYTPTGQAALIEHPDGGRFRVDYLLSRVEKWDAEMSDADAPMVEQYNALGSLIRIENPDGAGNKLSTAYDVDYAGRILRITDAQGNESARYVYAGPGASIQIDHIESGRRTYWRDAAGNLRLRTDSLGRRLEMNYDQVGRLLTAVDATDAANPQIIRQMNYNGRFLARVDEGEVSTQYASDVAGRQTTVTVDVGDGQPLTVGREYGLQGEMRALTYPDGTRVEIARDTSGTARGLSGFVNSVQYDAHGSPLTVAFTGGVTAEYGYDPAMKRLLNATLRHGASVLRHFDLTFDRNGNITTIDDQMVGDSFGRVFKFDRLYRLTDAETHQVNVGGALTRTDHYAYSPIGNVQRNGEGSIAAYEYADAAHPSRLTGIQRDGNLLPLSHDAVGRLTGFDHITDLQYDIWDRVIAVTQADGTVTRFQYDHGNARARKTVDRPDGSQIVTRYVENLYETGTAGTRLNIYLSKLLVASRETPAGGATVNACILTDHLGSILTTCDPAGQLLHQQVYTPFGIPLAAPTSDSRYIGMPSDDELGMVQMGARFYSPLLGRFITPDWFVVENPRRAQRMPQGYNVYSYAVNNPIMLRDPTGLWFGLDDLIVAAVGFVVGFVTGIIVEIAQGRSFGDTLLLGLEGGLVGAAGAWLAYATAGIALGGLSAIGLGVGGGAATGIMIGAAVVGGLNGVISGVLQIYDWSSPVGWLSFLSDSSWGLLGTTIGVLWHGLNLFDSDRRYRSDLSRHQNRHVYDGGVWSSRSPLHRAT